MWEYCRFVRYMVRACLTSQYNDEGVIKMKKRILAVVMSVCIVFGAGYIPAIAASVHDGVVITPFWTNTSAIGLGMSYSDGAVIWSGYVVGNTNAKTISVTYKLEKKDSNGKYVPCGLPSPWSFSSDSETLHSSGSYTGAKGSYKLTITGTVTSKTGYAEPIETYLERTFS